jgi:hypothetical protein
MGLNLICFFYLYFFTKSTKIKICNSFTGPIISRQLDPTMNSIVNQNANNL